MPFTQATSIPGQHLGGHILVESMADLSHCEIPEAISHRSYPYPWPQLAEGRWSALIVLRGRPYAISCPGSTVGLLCIHGYRDLHQAPSHTVAHGRGWHLAEDPASRIAVHD